MTKRRVPALRNLPILMGIALMAGLVLDAPGRSEADRIAPSEIDAAKAEYVQHCASCHGADRRGGQFGPSLISDAFRAKWSDAGALYDYLYKQMPPGAAGTLSKGTYQRLVGLIRDDNHLTGQSTRKSDGDAPLASQGKSETQNAEAIAFADTLPENRDAAYAKEMERRRAIALAIPLVPESTLRNGSQADWPASRRTEDGQGHSPLSQITPRNVHSLSLVYAQALPAGTNAISPLVIGGVIFINSNGTVSAIEAQSGKLLWKFERAVPAGQFGSVISQPRGIAAFEDKLFVPTLDKHIIALNMRTGAVVWDHAFDAPATTAFTGIPIVVRGKVIMGLTGCADPSTKCFMAALDTSNGAELWRFYTIPRPDERGGDSWNNAPYDQRGGGSIWGPSTYDAENNLLYFGTGSTYKLSTLMTPDPAPNATNAGLYTDTTLALDPDTGKLVWHYQHMARDVWDLDWAFERTVATIDVEGRPRKVVMTIGKLGILDVLDAKTGSYIFSVDLGVQNLVTAIDSKTGYKTTDPHLYPEADKWKTICPLSIGVRNWPATSFDPDRNLLFVPASDSCMKYGYAPGASFELRFQGLPRADGDGNYGLLSAINLTTRKIQWMDRRRASVSSSALSTRSGLVFSGSLDTTFRASESGTGKELWSVKLDGRASSSPVTFEVDGTQYIAVTSGGSNPNDSLRQYLTPELQQPPSRTTLWVFALTGRNKPFRAKETAGR